MTKRTILAVVAGICVTELIHYFGYHAEPLFYVYVVLGAATAAYLSDHACSGIAVSAYVLCWKLFGLVFLLQAYGKREVAGSFFLFLLDWTLVILAGVAGGYLGPYLRKQVERKRSRAQAG